MAFAFITAAHGAAATSTGAASATLNSTGAGALFAFTTNDIGAPVPVLNDSNGNTWTHVSVKTFSVIQLNFYSCNPTTIGSGHVVTVPAGGVASFPAIVVLAYSKSVGINIGQITSNSVTSTTLQPGNIVPIGNNALILEGQSNRVGTPSTLSGATIRDQSPATSAYGVSGGDSIQTTATAINPTWTVTPSSDIIAMQIEVYDAIGTNRVSSAPVVTLETGGSAARVSAVPLLLLEPANASGKVSSAPLLTLETSGSSAIVSSAPLLIIYGNSAAPAAVVTGFNINCANHIMTITGTNFPLVNPTITITRDGHPVDFTYLYGNDTQIVVQINNFVNGIYSVRVQA